MNRRGFIGGVGTFFASLFGISKVKANVSPIEKPLETGDLIAVNYNRAIPTFNSCSGIWEGGGSIIFNRIPTSNETSLIYQILLATFQTPGFSIRLNQFILEQTERGPTLHWHIIGQQKIDVWKSES